MTGVATQAGPNAQAGRTPRNLLSRRYVKKKEITPILGPFPGSAVVSTAFVGVPPTKFFLRQVSSSGSVRKRVAGEIT
jgi:hypothetical protein